MKKIVYTITSLILLASTSCMKTDFDEFESTQGTANFSTVISVGDSYTQGFQDGGLHNEFGQQQNSYPSIIAQQMGANFVQPLVSGTGSGYMHLEYRNGEIAVIKNYDHKINNNDPQAIDYDPTYTTWGDKTIKYNNLGVGGLNVRNIIARNTTEALEYHIYLGTSAPAPLAWNGVAGGPISSYGRFLDFGTISNRIEYIEHVKNSNATFFTNWLGINDAMGWAKSGGDAKSGAAALTDASEFREKYDTLLDVFQNMGAQGVCATIFDFTESPLFTTITLEAVDKDIWIKEGADTTIIRKAVPEDLMLLSALSLIKEGVGLTVGNPLPHQHVLDKDEKIIVKNHINILNNEIRLSANAHGFPVVDMYNFMNGLTSGMVFDGVNYSTKFIEGGAYSLDGLHPNTRGNAIIANEFIRVINENYKSSLRPVAVNEYRGIIFPN
jgi:lysophospholipase L1-like esterase